MADESKSAEVGPGTSNNQRKRRIRISITEKQSRPRLEEAKPASSFESSGSKPPSSLERSGSKPPSSLESSGSKPPCINVNSMTALLMKAVNAEKEYFPVDMPSKLLTEIECKYLLEALAKCVPKFEPIICKNLYEVCGPKQRRSVKRKRGDAGDKANEKTESGDSGAKPKDTLTSSESKPVEMSWTYVARHSTYDKWKNLKVGSPEALALEEKMSKIMETSMEVDPFNFPLCDFGYTLVFWITKIYNASGLEDRHLTIALQIGKKYFLHLFHETPWNDGCVCIDDGMID